MKRTVFAAVGYSLFLLFYYSSASWSEFSLLTYMLVPLDFFHTVMRMGIALGYAAALIVALRFAGRTAAALRIASIVLLVLALAFQVAPLILGEIPLVSGIAALFFGLFTAVTNVCWVAVLASLARKNVRIVLVVSTVGSAALVAGSVGASQISPVMLAMCIAVALIVSEFFLAFLGRGESLQDIQNVPRSSEVRTRRLSSTLYGLLPTIVCCMFVSLLEPISGMMVDETQLSSFLAHNSSWAIGNAVGAVLIFLVWRTKGANVAVPDVFVMAVPVVTAVVVLFPFVDAAFWPLFVVLSECLRTMVVLSVIAVCLEVGRSKKTSSLTLFCVFALLMFLSDLLGGAIGDVTGQMVAGSSDRMKLIGLLFVFLACGILFAVRFMRRAQKEQIAPMGWRSDAALDATEDASLLAASDGSDGLEPAVASSELAATVHLAACQRVAERFGLSKRETEVFVLQAKGRNVPFIAEELCVSKQTVRSHVKRIHQALDVHSQQELIDLVDQNPLP